MSSPLSIGSLASESVVLAARRAHRRYSVTLLVGNLAAAEVHHRNMSTYILC